MTHSITHIIFDFDGVLVDTEGLYTIANSQCLESYGKVFTNEMKIAQMGRKKDEGISYNLLGPAGEIFIVDLNKKGFFDVICKTSMKVLFATG